MLTIDATLKAEYEDWSASPAEELSTHYLKAGEKYIQGRIDRELEDSDLTDALFKQSLFVAALFFQNNKDFLNRQDDKAIDMHLDKILPIDLNKFVPES